jgi:hypothetical protein
MPPTRAATASGWRRRLVEFREFMNTFEVVQQVLDRQLAV